jgi:ammonia channel protein AmtB
LNLKCDILVSERGSFKFDLYRYSSEHPIQEIGTQIGVQLASICYAIVWNVACTFILLKFIDVCHGGFNWRLTAGLYKLN